MFSSVVHAEFCWICGIFPQYARARSWKIFQPRARDFLGARARAQILQCVGTGGWLSERCMHRCRQVNHIVVAQPPSEQSELFSEN